MFCSYNLSEFQFFLKNTRKKLKLTQYDVNHLTGINTDTLRKIESGLVIPRYETLAILSECYKIDLIRIFSHYKNDESIIQIYCKLDEHILDNNIQGITDIISELEDNDLLLSLNSQMICKTDVLQLKMYAKSILIFFQNKSTLDLELLKTKIEKCLILTQPKFSIITYFELRYNFFEIRILLLYALVWAKLKKFEISNKLLFFILEWIDFMHSDTSLKDKYKILVHFNLSYNYHNLDNFYMSLQHANQGIEICILANYIKHLPQLLYRKFTSEHYLNIETSTDTLRKCYVILDLLGKWELKEKYIIITKEKYKVNI